MWLRRLLSEGSLRAAYTVIPWLDTPTSSLEAVLKSHESDLNDHASDQLELAQVIYFDACAKCTADVSDKRDLLTMRSRVAEEGLSFLTITLPNFCKDFERSLAQGRIDSTCFQGFRKSKKYGAIPAFLQGMLSHLFDGETGRIFDDPPRDADQLDHHVYVEVVRQICLAFKKLEIQCTPERTYEAVAGFVKTERDLLEFQPDCRIRDRFDHVSTFLWTSVVSGIDLEQLKPRHGPGATAERVSGNQKFAWQRWHERLEPYFPFLGTAYPIGVYDAREFEEVAFVPPEQEQPVRVTPVPKTQKGPRIIAIEPCCTQFAQQAIRDALYERIEKSKMAGGHVNFTDQSINRSMALMASKTGQLATIDLSEASDRVPHDLALDMFNCHPDLRDAVDACRSTHAELPDGTIIGPLRKFASMGSALCFPVEAMYFYTACVEALLEIQNLPINHATCFQVSRDVYIYGDDIIVPRKYAVAVLDHLQRYNCKVNKSKTFWNGKFRESCGLDAYAGEEVTPTYVRQLHPKNRRQAGELISFVKTANLFYKRGYWKTANYMFCVVEAILGLLPFVAEDSPGLGRNTFLGGRSIERWNCQFQRFEVKCWVPEPIRRTDELEGYAALMKSFSVIDSKSSNLSSDPHHLMRSVRHGVATLKRRWVPAQ